MADIEILRRARSVDYLSHAAFRERANSVGIDYPESVDIKGGGVHIFYGINFVDGRQLASRFITFLETQGRNYRLLRPPELDDPAMNLVAFGRLDQRVVNQRAIARAGGPDIANLNSYSLGDLTLIDETGAPEFYMRGARREVTSFSIRAKPFGDDQTSLYRRWVKKLGWNRFTPYFFLNPK